MAKHNWARTVSGVRCAGCGISKRKARGAECKPKRGPACWVCGGDGWTDGSAALRRDSKRDSTECLGCGGTGIAGADS